MKRTVAGLVAMCLVAAACGGAEEAEPATELPDGVRPSDGALIDAAFGSTQTVQDFVIYLDLALQTDDGLVSFYQEVLDQAASGARDPVALAGGFVFEAVDSLEGEVTNGDGEPLPTISLDFGLITPTAESVERIGGQLADVLTGSGDPEVAAFVTAPAASPVLVEIATAEFSKNRRHVGPGDLSSVDLTFLDRLEPGDALDSVYYFGQTLPVDAADEVGLTPNELFALRWNQGSIRVLGSGGQVRPVADDTLRVVDGSDLMTREMKLALLEQAYLERLDTDQEILQELDLERFLDTLSVIDPELVEGLHQEFKACIVAGVGADECMEGVHLKVGLIATQVALAASLRDCEASAAWLNERNSEAGIPQIWVEGFEGIVDPIEDLAGPDTTIAGQEIPPGPVSCGELPSVSGWGGTFGDVHLTLFDGLSYSNQAVGEFLIFGNGTTQVQMRQEPWPGSDAVSIMTSAAVSVGDHAVSMHVNGELWIDEMLVELELGDTIAIGDAEMLWGLFGWLLIFPDMTEVQVDLFDDNMVLTVKPQGSGPITGMLGDGDGNRDNDFVTRTGQQLDVEAQHDFESFYPTYIDSWRITQEESLFHYGPGESTDSFLIDGFPEFYATVEELTPEQRAEAERICRELGLTREDLLPMCILDVGLTGDPVFAYQAFIIEDRTSPPEAPAQVGATGESRLQVGGLTLELGADTGTWQCEASPGRFWALTGISDGSDLYDLAVEYFDEATSDTGEEKLTMTLFLNGTPHAWMSSWLYTPTGTIESLTMDGSSLSVSGTAFVNDPLDPISPAFPPPAGSELVPFSLEATCDG